MSKLCLFKRGSLIAFLSINFVFSISAIDNPNQNINSRFGFIPTSFKLAFNETYKDDHKTSRKIMLYLNDQYAGDITYTIRVGAECASTINVLHVERPYRGHYGCGKMLLRSAVDDIMAHGSYTIELHRSPFDLPPGDIWTNRNEQLVKWYGNFGFENKYQGAQSMVLKDFSKLYSLDIASFYNTKGIEFKPRCMPDNLKATLLLQKKLKDDQV